MYHQGLRTLVALNDLVRDLGPSINLLERMLSDQLGEQALQGLLDHLPKVARVTKHLVTPKKDTLKHFLCYQEVRSLLVERLSEMADEADAMLFASRLQLIREFNRNMWKRILREEINFVPELPRIDPKLLDYLQRQLQFAIVYLPESKIVLPRCGTQGELRPLDFDHGGQGRVFRSEPSFVEPGWYAVEKIPPCHFGLREYDILGRVMSMGYRQVPTLKLIFKVFIPGIEHFLGIPSGSVQVPSVEEHRLFIVMSESGGYNPDPSILNMFGDCNCKYWCDSNNPELCRNCVVETDSRNVGSVPSPYRVVAGGTGGGNFGYSNARHEYFYADLAKTKDTCFRVMVNLDKCVGVEFDTASHPPQFTCE